MFSTSISTTIQHELPHERMHNFESMHYDSYLIFTTGQQITCTISWWVLTQTQLHMHIWTKILIQNEYGCLELHSSLLPHARNQPHDADYKHIWHTRYLYFSYALCLLARRSGNSVSLSLRFIRWQLSRSDSSADFSASTSLSLVISSSSTSATATFPPTFSLHSTQAGLQISSQGTWIYWYIHILQCNWLTAKITLITTMLVRSQEGINQWCNIVADTSTLTPEAKMHQERFRDGHM